MLLIGSSLVMPSVQTKCNIVSPKPLPQLVDPCGTQVTAFQSSRLTERRDVLPSPPNAMAPIPLPPSPPPAEA